MVYILTTGLVKPSEEMLNMLINPKIVIALDNYGNELSENQRKKYAENKAVLENAGIEPIEIDNTNGSWHSMGAIAYRGYSEERTREMFRSCYFSSCRYITQDLHFETCGLPARIRHLGYDFSNPADTVELRGKSSEQLRKELTAYLSKRSLSACNYCNGCSETNIIKAGEQKGQV